MAVRHATRRYTGLGEFFEDYEKSIKAGALALRPDELDGEPAREIRLDLVLPLVGRVGPLRAQVVARAPDGTVGFRIPEIPEEVQGGFDKLQAHVDEVARWLISSGRHVPMERYEDLKKKAAALASRPASGQEQRGSEEPRPAPQPAAPVPRRRGFEVPDVSRDTPLAHGSMADRSLRDSLVKVAVGRITGLLVVASPDSKRRFGFWNSGGPVAWRNEPIEESTVLGVLLHKAGRVTKDQLAESLIIMEEQGIRQGEALIQQGVLNFPQLILALQKQAEMILHLVMNQREGVWAFYELDNLPERFITPPLRVPSLLFRALSAYARTLPMEKIATAHRPNLDRYVFLAEGVEDLVNEIQFTKAEHKFVEILRSNSWRLRELFSVSNLARIETASVLWALNELSFVAYRKEETRERYLGRISGRIEQKVAQIYAGTLFDVLEIHWICLPEEVKTAGVKLRKEFDPSNFRDLPDELGKKLASINEAVDEAYETLSDDVRRRLYREEVIEKGKITQSAEILARKGEMAILKQERVEAVTCWGKAADLVPSNSDYRAGLARARVV